MSNICSSALAADGSGEWDHRGRAEQPDLHARGRERRGVGRHREVAGGDELTAGGGGDPPYLGDHRLGKVVEAQHQVGAHGEQLGVEAVVATRQLGEVVTGGERRSMCVDHDDRAHVVDRVERVDERADHVDAERVATRGTVEGDRGTSAVDGDGEGLPGHAGYGTPMAIELDFGGMVVLVTGGTKGVGRGIAQRFGDAGATVAVCSRSEPDGLPDGWAWFGVDLRDGEAAWATVDAVVDRLGRIDVLVNNAGGSPPADTTTATPRFTERIVALNLFAAIFCSQRANHWMQQQDTGGSMINIGSVSGQRPTPQTAAYGAAKAGLISFTQTVAVEWAPKVRVNLVTAGMVRTEQSHLFYGDEEGIAEVGKTVPLGRIADPGDIGDACLFLSSPLAGYVSGANLAVHGGGEPPPYLDVSAL